MKLITLCFFTAIFILSNKSFSQNDNKVFGDSIFTSNGLKGKIYLLATGTRMLPDFDTMQPVDTLYTKTIDVSPRSWQVGFPGLRDRFEWFGIEYKGSFKPAKKGHYKFRLLSDDGSKLFIDDSLIINNDGQHGAASKGGEIDLDNAVHSIKIQYFQGPRYGIALQLFSSLPNEKEEIFPGNNFILYTETPHCCWLWWIIAAAIILGIIILIFSRRKKKK
jgi:hypothetical protein